MSPGAPAPAWQRAREDLERSLQQYDDASAGGAVGVLVAHLDGADHPPVTDLLGLLDLLRRHRRFALVEQLAEALLRTDAPPPEVRRHYAQALIERGASAAAVGVLDDLARADVAEAAEARGLLGRAAKESFLALGAGATARRRAALERALEAYWGVYRADPDRLWHGTNAAALLMRAAREAIPVSGVDDPQAAGVAIAADVAARLARGGGGSWAWAIGIESDVALGRIDDALSRLRGKAAEAGAFELGSLRRQLVRIWQLRPDSPPGSVLLPPLEALLLMKQGAELTLTGADAGASAVAGTEGTTAAGFEKVFGAEGAQTQAWFEDLLRRCRAVARIDGQYAQPKGTGFLLRGPDLHHALPEVVLVTNAHVVPDAVAPEDAVVTFLGLGRALPGVGVTRLLWTSPRDRLDTTVLEIGALPPGVEVNPATTQLPALGARPPNRVFVVGHPMGSGDVRIAIRDNDLLDHDETVVHYRAPTEPGSSGSPVYDDRWRVVAVHHRGLDAMPRLHGPGVYPANEGVRLSRIRSALAADLLGGTGR